MNKHLWETQPWLHIMNLYFFWKHQNPNRNPIESEVAKVGWVIVFLNV